jgi:hypothetical protein
MAKSLHEVAREFLRQLRGEKEQRGEKVELPRVEVEGTPRPNPKACPNCRQ